MPRPQTHVGQSKIKNLKSKIEIFGIRHHGPGSARMLRAELERLAPDCILIEGPPDADHLIPLVNDPEMRPPVAILIYNPKNLGQASFYPFAEFSPEWQAMIFGLKNKTVVRFMDLPMSQQFLLRAETSENQQVSLQFDATGDPDEALLRLDPFTRIARLAGYSDSERWWDALVERHPSDTQSLNYSITQLISALRADKTAAGQFETRETLLREAHMRHTVRAAEKEGFQKIALVCGAWHTPALVDFEKTKAADTAILKGLKKVKTEATWIPWTFDRLATASGYGAGVISPAWYRLLFSKNENATAEWFARTARLLREHDLMVSSAHVIEAIRLADALAKIRRTALPDIEELREAAVTVLCEGSGKSIELIENQMIIGEEMGAVPSSVPVVPLKADFEAQVKTCRLKISSTREDLDLDLREESHLRKSKLLHRLRALGIEWGRAQGIRSGKQGRFHENWSLQWLPDFEIKIIEAGAWGNTVEDAAGRFVWQKIRDAEKLTELVGLLDLVLKAELPAVFPDLLKKLRDTAALSKDTLTLADAVPPLADVLRYGHARAMNFADVERLVEQIVPRVCVGLPAACTGVDEETAEEILKKMLAFNRALAVLRKPDFDEIWQKTLENMASMAGIAALLGGLATRLLFDKQVFSAEKTADSVRFQLSHAAEPASGAMWLEGFLNGSGLLLIHQPALWQLLDDWVSDLDFDVFREILPLLRRTFSRFPPHEREKMLALVKHGGAVFSEKKLVEVGFSEERGQAVVPVLRLILG